MNNRLNNLRRQIKALRTNMLRAEAVMRDQINRNEDCTQVAEELLHMRAVMSEMIREREAFGDREAIEVKEFFIPRAPPTKIAQPKSLNLAWSLINRR